MTAFNADPGPRQRKINSTHLRNQNRSRRRKLFSSMFPSTMTLNYSTSGIFRSDVHRSGLTATVQNDFS